MATKKTSKRALPDVPGAAMVQALGDAVFGKGNAVVVQTYPVTYSGRWVTVNLSVREVVAAYKARTPFGSPRLPKTALEMPSALQSCIVEIANLDKIHPLDVVDAILAARHGAAPPGDADAITAAILRLFAVAPDKGIAEDEVTRHLLASGLDVDADDVSDRLVKMHVADVLKEAWRGKADKRRALPLVYARGPAFPVAS